jgi:hypothetical protein
MCGLKSHDITDRFSRDHGELQARLYPGLRHKEVILASPRRSRFAKTSQVARDIMGAASTDLVHALIMRKRAPTLTRPSWQEASCS